MNIVEIAAGSDDFNILVNALTAVDADTDILSFLATTQDLTVFAPTDAAFGQLAADLGFAGDTADEDAVFTFIAEGLTALSDDNLVPLLTGILTYHVAGELLEATDVIAQGTVQTLQSGSFFFNGTNLVDNAPTIADPALVETDIAADNGIIHAIDRVLLPFTFDGTQILLGDPQTRDDLDGGADSDVLVSGLFTDDMTGNAGADTFVLDQFGDRDIVRDFVIGEDTMDVSRFADSFEDLEINSLVRRDGSTAWVEIKSAAGEDIAVVRFGDETALDGAALGASDFQFSAGPLPAGPANILSDADGRDNLSGTGASDVFTMLDDDSIDTIRFFDASEDLIDVSAFATSIDELTITNRVNGAGTTRWIDVADASGETEILVRFDADTALDAANLTADLFVFGVA